MIKKIAKYIAVAVISILTVSGLFAEMIYTVQVESPMIRGDRFDNKMPKLMNVGEPMIPYHSLQILMPQGNVFKEVEIAFRDTATRSVSFIDFATEPIPISQSMSSSSSQTMARREVYERDSFYPYTTHEVLGVSRKKGYDILSINVYPYQYNPVTNTLRWSSEFTLTIRYEYDEETAYQQNLFLVANQKTREELAKLVMNPEIAATYQKQNMRNDALLPDPGDPHRMIIISNESKEEVFEDFIEWKFSKGISTAFFTTEDIYDTYEGIDRQDKIRNFIIDAYQSYSQTDTPLEYVILGGDDKIIPIRTMYGRVANTIDNNMPADLYYSNLDGNWNANGNDIYGEPDDDVDWYAEVSLGRIPAFTDTQFERFFYKTYYYADNNSYSNDIAYMLGEKLDNIPTWGGDYKDEILPLLPQGYKVDTRYDRDGTFSSQAVEELFHGGLAIINHMGHANHNTVFGLNNSRIARLANTEYGFAYTQGCYPAAFDFATSEESGCVGQNLTIAKGGLFAFIGNTRYGWYRRGTTNGPSQAFDIAFFKGLYEHNIKELGEALIHSREVLVNQAIYDGVMRWIFYDMVLFGDPSIAVKNPLGTFPYVEPANVVFDDYDGDKDGMVNPGETIDVYFEIANLEGWANADETFGKLFIEDEHIEVVRDSSMFGFIPTNDSATNEYAPFKIKLDETTPYRTYQLQLTLTAKGLDDAHFSRVYSVPLKATLLQKHWPLSTKLPISANPVVFDTDSDGTKEVVMVDIQGNVKFFNYDASISADSVSNAENIWRSTAYADLTGDGTLDIIMNSRNNKIVAYSTVGDTLFTYDSHSQIVLTPIVADFKMNGEYQIAALDIDNWLHLIDSSGNSQPGSPIRLSHTAVADLAAADITGDGYNEIIVGTLDGNLYAIRHNGCIVPNYPINLEDQIIAAPIVLHNYDIVTATREKLFLISRDGEILMEKETPGRVSLEVIAADFTNCHSLKFAYVTNNGYIDIIDRNGDSLPGFPIDTGESFLHPPLAADINGDGCIDLICYSANGTIYGFNNDGSNMYGLPFPMNVTISAPATIADIDGDGDAEIILATSNGISIVDYKYSYQTLEPWITYRGNLQRTGFYGEDEALSAEEVVKPLTTALLQNYPNPFNPTTQISFSLKEDSHTKLEIFNIKGQLIATLLNDFTEAGHHTISWNGTNNKREAVGSGVYFYRLIADDSSFSKKMMLIK